MKQSSFRGFVPIMAVFMLLTIWPTNANAKKIKYSDQIVYDGKVDANGLPRGEGKLITSYGDYKDVLEGIFDNTTVTSATLRLKIYDKKYNFFEYLGTVEYAIADNTSSISYKLTDGGFSADIASEKDFNYKNEYPEIKIEESFVVTKETPLTITNNLQECYDNFKVDNVTKSYEVTNLQKELSLLQSVLSLIDSSNLGTATHVKKLVSFRVDASNFNFYPQPNASKELLYNGGAIVRASNTAISCKYANGDYCNVDKAERTAGFRKTLADGVLSKDASSTLITYEGKEKSAATTMSGIEDVAAFMKCKTMDDAKELYIFYFDPLREALIKSLKRDADAMFQLGKAIYEGDGIDKNVKRGKAWLKDAVQNGSEEAKKYCIDSNIKIVVSEVFKKKNEEYLSRGGDTYEYTYLDGDKVVKDREYLYDGTVYHMNNGLLEVKGGKMYFTTKDNLKFVGYFKEQRNDNGFLPMENTVSVLNNETLTPWYGTVTYKDGTSEQITEGIKPKTVPVEIGSIKEIDEAIALTKGTNFVDCNYKVTLPLNVVGDMKDNSSVSVDDIKATVTLEVMNFGQDGNTILQTYNFNSPEVPNKTMSWSGKNVHLMPAYDKGVGTFAILRGNTICGQVACVKKDDGKLVWAGIVNTVEEAITMSDFYKGMTIAEVEALWKQLNFCQFKLSGNSGKYKIYSAYWLDMRKRYNIFGNYKYVMRNDKKYADYYFDSQGKLVKWILYI